MRKALLVALVGSLLALSACNKTDEGGNAAAAPAAAAGAVKAVAPPAGTSWTDTVAATPELGMRMGNPNAPLKLIEYGSFTCPHCAEFSKTGDEPLAKYVESGKVSFEYRSFLRDPLDMTMALVARCGGPATFFAMKGQMFANQPDIVGKAQAAGEAGFQQAMALPLNQRFVKLAEIAGLIDFAKARGLPEAQARTCLADIKQAEAIAKGNDLATGKFNVQGTPTLILNGSVLENVATWPTLETRLKDAGA